MRSPISNPLLNVRATGRPLSSPESGSAIQIEDLTYALFRHKWKILLATLLGLVAGGLTLYTANTEYASDAKVMVRYVVESHSGSAVDSNDKILSPDARSSSMIASEMELLHSGDLARDVVAALGATNVLKAAGGGDSEGKAAGLIRSGLDLTLVPKTSIIQVSFRHPDPSVARDVVRTLIERYLRLHARVHGSIDQLEDLRRKYDFKRKLVEDREGELRTKESELNLTLPLAESRRLLAGHESSIEIEVLTTEALLAEAQAPFRVKTNSEPNSVPKKNLESSSSANQAPEPIRETDPAVVSSFRSLITKYESLGRRQQELLLTFSPSSSFLRPVAAQLTNVVRDLNNLVAAHPGLTNLPKVVDPKLAAASSAGDAAAEVLAKEKAAGLARIASLEAKLGKLREQLETIRTRARLLANKESSVAQAQRKLEEANKEFSFLNSALERAIAEEVVASSSRLANISVIESASTAHPAVGKELKIATGLLLGGPFLGLGMAALLEFFIDKTLRRRRQVVDQLGIPLILSIPRLKFGRTPKSIVKNLTPNGATAGTETKVLVPYAEALRDRLIKHFEQRELDHKPKLIGLTSCGKGTGVTELAAALAASLSETGEGKVLYIDVNSATGPSAHPFQRGQAVAKIQDVLDGGERQSAMVHEQLYAVSLADQQGSRIGVFPKTISDLVPKIQASDYDYIIFDLPPVSQISITARVAGLLDVNVMVLDCEKTLVGRAVQAVRLLAENNSNVVAVFNKHRRYVPGSLDADI